MTKEWSQYTPIAQAVTMLFHPFVEVVIHDLRRGRIKAVFNNLSKRKPGDESLLQELGDLSRYKDIIPPYPKTNWNGGKMKSVTAIIKNAKGKPIGLFCINIDLSKWDEIHDFILKWMQVTPQSQPKLLFAEDWREKINVYISAYLQQQGISMLTLKRDRAKKQKLIQTLQNDGAFQAKNSILYVADVLGISRASIYNYLKKEV
ncbi:MAG: PAS domain-containing protein [Verrucomicrobia bacterium]|nr:PAS domain-containing protein [Verrucomicrobiota bacterium]